MSDSTHVVGLALLRVAAVAHREGLDLPPLVRTLAEEHRGFARRRLRQLAKLLDAGTPLVQAVEQTWDLLNDEDVLALRFATQTGTLKAAYQELIDRAASRSHEAAYQVRQALVYGASLTLVVGLVLTFLMMFVSPTLVQMFQEFGLSLPLALTALIQTSSTFVRYLPLVALIVPVFVAVIWLLRPTRIWRHWISSRVVKSAAQLRVSGLLRLLALALDAGRPLSGSLSTLARYHFDRGVRVKMLVARNEVEQGAEYWASLEHANLLSRHEAQALAGASTNELRVWLMRRLASQKEEQVEFRQTFFAMLVHPAIVVLFGMIVLWVSIAFFSVLVSMISSLS